MKTLCAALLLLLQEPLPQDAQKIVSSADAKLESLRKSYEEACARVKTQELKDLQRIHDAIEKGNPAGAAAIKAKIDVLSADVSIAMKPPSTIEQWLQGKWIVSLGGAGEVIEFKGSTVSGNSADRTKGRIIVDASSLQIVWDSGYVETMRISKTFSDDTTGVGRSGIQTFKRLK